MAEYVVPSGATGGNTAGNIHWKAPVADFASLPAEGNSYGDARITLDTGGIYVWKAGTPDAWFKEPVGEIALDEGTILLGNSGDVAAQADLVNGDGGDENLVAITESEVLVKSLVAGSGVSLASDTDTVTISATGGGATATVNTAIRDIGIADPAAAGVSLGVAATVAAYELDASIAHDEAGVPGLEVGLPGDAARDTDTGKVYLKNIWSGWFDTGATGNGAFTSGSAAPDNGDGSDGDLYLRTTTAIIYKKDSGAWGAESNTGDAGVGTSVSLLYKVTVPDADAVFVCGDIHGIDGDDGTKALINGWKLSATEYIAFGVVAPSASGNLVRYASPARKVGGGFEIAYLDADGVMVHAMHVAGFSDDGLGDPTAAGQPAWFGIIGATALNAPGGFNPVSISGVHIRGLAMKNGVLYTMGDADADGYPALTEALP